tara:strand:+ start:159 stop:725 length:567 start_codon:yes stop_codon:yes gene_type:complete
MKIVICLSHELKSDGSLSVDSRKRMTRSCEIFEGDNCDFLVTTGWRYRPELLKSLAQIMAEFAMNNHMIPKERILCESAAKDTIGEAFFINENIIKKYRVSHVNVVTSDWHIQRAREIFDFILGKGVIIQYFETLGQPKINMQKKEEKSIQEFRKLISGCKIGDNICISDRIFKYHNLYKDTDQNAIK